MAKPSPGSQCAFCGKDIGQPCRGGRPKDYCDPACRRRAQRQRDRERRAAKPSHTEWQVITGEMFVRTQQLLTAGSDQLDLATALDLTARLHQDAECLAAVAVDSARCNGWTWTEVATAAGLSTAAARARWGGVRVQRLVSERAQLSMSEPTDRHLPLPASSNETGAPSAAASKDSAVQELGTALRTLHARSGVSLQFVSDITGLSLPVITAMFDGCRVLSWPETYMLSHALGGDPQDLQLLWHWAQGVPLPTGAVTGPGRLGAALRGAQLAAGLPDIAASCPPGLSVAESCAALAGEAAPDWPLLSGFLVRLGADPSRFASLWMAARAAQHPIRTGER
ncbi:hypothetical protein ACFUAC_29885 [Streptomyces sp. NPDC057148]|uniref:hypothetical protein n=1 Tax=unclassified Streptomyces TaxID=2593676 RepID=UPI0036284FA0